MLISLPTLFLSCMSLKPEEPKQTYPPLIVDPKYKDGVKAFDNVQYYTTGGKPPYSYVIKSGGGDIGFRTGFYTAGEVAGAVLVEISDSSGLSTTATINVVASPPYQLNIEVRSPTVLTSECVELRINTIDEYQNNARRSHSRDIFMSGESKGNYYTDPSCGIELINGKFTLEAGDTDQPIYFRDYYEESITANAHTDGLSDGNQIIDIFNSGVAVKFVIIEPADCNVGDSCSIEVQAQDAVGNLVDTYESNVTLWYTGTHSAIGGFGEVDIVSGSAIVQVIDSVSETVNLILKDPQGTITNVEDTSTITFRPITPAKYVILEPTDTLVGNPATIEVQIQDSLGNMIQESGSITLLTGASSVELTSGSPPPITVNIVSGRGVVTITDYKAETAPLTLTNASVTSLDYSSSKDIKFTGKSAVLIKVVQPAPAEVRSVNDTPIVVQALDEYGNIDLSISGSVELGLSGAAFGVAGAGVCKPLVLVGGVGSCSIGDRTAETVAISITKITIPARPDITINSNANGNSTIIFTAKTAEKYEIQNPIDRIAGESALITIKALDEFGNLTNLNCSNAANLTVDKHATILTGSAINFASGVATETIKDNVAEAPVTIALEVNGGSSCMATVPTPDLTSSVDIIFTAGNVEKYVIMRPTDTVIDATTEVVVQAQDASGNISYTSDGDVVFLSADSATVVGAGVLSSGQTTFLVSSSSAGQFILSLGGVSDIDTTSQQILVVSDCPVGYIEIPAVANPASTAFCVSKYIMGKDGSNNVVSQVAPVNGYHTGIDKSSASTACPSYVGYTGSLITNVEWQIIAHNIEGVASNWQTNVVGGGDLNVGHVGNVPSSALFAGADANPCAGITGLENDPKICSPSLWHYNRRTHLLSNHTMIWDFGGNLRSLTSSVVTVPAASNPSTYISQIVFNGAFESDNFLPNGNYISKNSGNRGGLGYFIYDETVPEEKVIIRGGQYDNLLGGGIFSADISQSSADSSPTVGYRCVYKKP